MNIWFSVEIQDWIDSEKEFDSVVRVEEAITTKAGFSKISHTPIFSLKILETSIALTQTAFADHGFGIRGFDYSGCQNRN